MKRKFLKILLIAVFIISICNSIVYADFGDFESYDSGSSSWSNSDWGGSDWNSGSSRRSSSSSSRDTMPLFLFFNGGSGGAGLIIFLIIVGITIYKNSRNSNNYNRPNYNPESYRVPDQSAEEKIKEIDENFNKEEFLLWVKDVFVKMQNAWSKRDLSTLRVYQADALYEQSRLQVQGYIDRKQINMLERICVEGAELMAFRQSGDKDIIEVRLKSKMQDYIIDEETKNIIRGQKDVEKRSTYKMTFIRTTGEKTETAGTTVKTTNCPNCGAPTEITSSGKCQYCGSVITSGTFNWILSSIEKVG
ncbi:MAG: Tim44 domain-containing protein [Clostridia bacterium]|nr:Tim44 domain-containing protein [Clostridia bacterium]